MSENETTEATETPTNAKKHPDTKRTAIIVAVIVVFTLFFWLYASKLLGIRAAEREGVQSSAMTLSAAAVPLLDLQSKNMLGDAETLSRMVDQVVESRRFSFVAILDPQGRVIVASDRNVAAGNAYEGFESGKFTERGVDGKYEVIQPIKQGSAVYGAVVLRQP
jgi:hypothetical protein